MLVYNKALSDAVRFLSNEKRRDVVINKLFIGPTNDKIKTDRFGSCLNSKKDYLGEIVIIAEIVSQDSIEFIRLKL